MVAVCLLEAGAEPVFLVGGRRQDAAAAPAELIDDRYPGEGPLGGVVTALHAADAPTVFVAACDLVGMRPESVRAVVAALHADDRADAAVAVSEGHRLGVFAAYRRTCRDRLEARFAGGARSLRAGLDALDVVEVHDIAASELVDVDTPEDLARARAEARAGPEAGPTTGSAQATDR